jgi:glycosyltransferase involved in cell wall biosynthesis
MIEMTKKILLTTPTFPPANSGLGNAVQQLAKCLTDEGWVVFVATAGLNRVTLKDVFSGATIEVFNVSGADSVAQPIKGDKQSYVDYLKQSQFDIVLMNAWQTWSTDLVFANIENISGKKLLYSHCISTNSIVGKLTLRSFLRYLAWRPYWWSLSKKMQLLDGIIFLASEGCDARFDDVNLAKRLGINQFVIPNGISSAAFSAIYLPKKSFLEREGIISVGTYDWQKGHDFVLKAYSLSTIKNKVQLHLFGQQFTPFSEKLKLLASHLGLDPLFVHFHEGINQINLFEKYLESRLFLYGSHTECQPLVLLDAMAAGTPFISRASGSIPWMRGGVTVQSEIEAAKAIDELYENLEDWNVLSEAGHQQVQSFHTPIKVRESLIKALSMSKN